MEVRTYYYVSRDGLKVGSMPVAGLATMPRELASECDWFMSLDSAEGVARDRIESAARIAAGLVRE